MTGIQFLINLAELCFCVVLFCFLFAYLFVAVTKSDEAEARFPQSLPEQLPFKTEISLRDARKALFCRFSCDDSSAEYKREFQALTKRYESKTL
jgi:hypothetical protein